jgi:hypothetical protein
MNPKMGFVAFLYGVFVCLTAMVKGLFLPVALGRGLCQAWFFLSSLSCSIWAGRLTHPKKKEKGML